MDTFISSIRQQSHQLTGQSFETPSEVVRWMGAIQAQDYSMAKWAIGIRAANCNERSVEDAFLSGTILRTHIMRPTWHFVAPENLRWMRPLSASRIMSSSKSRDRDLGITEELYSRVNDIIGRTLEGGEHLSKDEIATVLEREGIAAGYPRMIHFLMRAEVEGIVCSGAPQGKVQTYALFDERVPYSNPLPREEALAKLARIYFTSHSPATIDDFAWWSGMSMKDVRTAVNAVREEFFEERIGERTFLVSDRFAINSTIERRNVQLLPAFDEYIISYKDRTDVLPRREAAKVISSNGVFRPVILVDGIARGLWKKTATKERVDIKCFADDDRLGQSSSVNAAIESYIRFIDN